MWNEQDVAEYKSILDSVDDSPTDGDSYDVYISTNAIEDICNGKYVHLYTNAINSRLKVREHISPIKIEWKLA